MSSTRPTGAEFARCAVCDRALAACWRFRDDDEHCGLCGDEVLRIVLSHSDPDGRVWLYRRPGKAPGLAAAWERGPAGRPARRRLRPEIDCSRSSAVLRHDDLGGELWFGLKAGPEQPEGSPWVKAHLVPRFQGFDTLALPPAGVTLWLYLATSVGMKRREAILLPHTDALLSWRCTEPSIRQNGEGVWQVYQKGEAVTVPLRLKAAVRACVLGVATQKDKPTSPDIQVPGFDKPVELMPGKSHPFELRVNNLAWPAKEPQPFHFVWNTTGGLAVPFEGRIAFVEGRRLEITPIDVRDQVQLGSVVTASFSLTASNEEGIEEGAIEIRRCQVHRNPDVGNWLRVVKPAEDSLPLVVPPGGDGRSARVLQLEIDTTRLARGDFNQQLLEGRVELYDSLARVWPCSMRVTARRPNELENYVAIDWGTTNTCAAYSTEPGVRPPTPVRFTPHQTTPEQFPSDIYFVDVTGDPDNPVFKTGFDADLAGKEHPECLLRSLKRKFQFLDVVTVIDERHNPRKYKVEDLARLLLQRLISQAEVTIPAELLRFGLTFPTKWGPRTRERLAGVARELESRLARERRPRPVEVLPPRIDEANAVAFNFLTTDDGVERPDHFYLIAYDFGGGTVDTSVLEVSYLEQTNQLRTRYVGIGGRPDFGGDDVTRAVLMILHARLSAALKGRELFKGGPAKAAVRPPRIPLVPDREPLSDHSAQGVYWYRAGRANWNVLWEGAEAIKRALCRGTPTDADGSATPIPDWIRENRENLGCEVEGQDETIPLLSLEVDLKDSDRFYHALAFTLDDVCRHPLPDIDNVNRGEPFTVYDRVKDTIEELRWQCDDAKAGLGRPVEPEIIVLAGGGCRLPLIKELMSKHFHPGEGAATRLVFQDDIAKQRVAHGLANYLAFLATPEYVEEIASSVDVLHHHLGCRRARGPRRGVGLEFVAVVRAGTPTDAPALWHAFTFDRSQVSGLGKTAGPGEATGPRLVLYSQDWRKGPREFGYFDLSRVVNPLEGDAPCVAEPLPLEAGAVYASELRLRRSAEQGVPVQKMDLCVTFGGKRYGPFPLVTTVADAESVLHG